MRPWSFPCIIWRVVDGDTVDCVVDLGFRSRFTPRVRLLGYNAPEMEGATREAGVASRDMVVEWALRHQTDYILRTPTSVLPDRYGRVTVACDTPIGGLLWPLVLQSEKGDSFDRWLGTITHGLHCLNSYLSGDQPLG